jgi:hypothetical protein
MVFVVDANFLFSELGEKTVDVIDPEIDHPLAGWPK